MNKDGATPERIVREVFEIEGSPGMVRMIDEMQAAGASSDEIFDAVKTAVAQGKARGQEPVNETVAEMAGPKTRGLAQATANVGTKGGPAAEKVVRRGQELSQDLEGSMTRALKTDSDDFYAKRAELAEKRATEGRADYEAAYETEAPVEPFLKALFDPVPASGPGSVTTPVVQRPRFQERVEDVAAMARKDGDVDLAQELETFLAVARKGERPNKALSTRAIDEIDRAIGEAREIASRAGEKRAASRLGDMQRALRVTDDATGLGTARAKAKVRIDASEAPDAGRKAWKRGR